MTDAGARSALYRLLAGLFAAEPTIEILGGLREPRLRAALRAAGATLDEALAGRLDAELARGLAVEYAALFLGPGPHVALTASPHLDGAAGGLRGPATPRLEAFLREAGFDLRPDYRDHPDHISVALEFMGALTEAEARAEEEGDRGETSRQRSLQRRFIEAFLEDWAVSLAEGVARRSPATFYGPLVGLLARFVRSERKALATAAR